MNTLITGDRLGQIKDMLKFIPPGPVIEVGVYKGGSLKVIADTVAEDADINGYRNIYGFDTFKGLPKEHYQEGEPHQVGDFNDTDILSVAKFIDNQNVFLVQGLFPDSAKGILDDTVIAFAHIDTDFYLAVKQSLEYVWPRLAEGGAIVFDDFKWGNCPGVEKALSEFTAVNRQKDGSYITIHTTEKVGYQAYIVKL